MKPRVVFLVGPTAVGKTALAVDLAKKIGAQIISCDSMQIYHGMPVLTSMPSPGELRSVKHYLVDAVAPSVDFNVSRYRLRALKAMREISGRRKVPLFAGGSGLYMSVMLDGIFKSPAGSERVRRALEREAQSKGSALLHARLAKADPEAAARIHPNDAKRIIRALEVFKVTGKPISRLQKRRNGLWGSCDVRVFCLTLPREELYRRIDRRVEEMFAAGLVDEVRNLLKRKLGRTARYAIGVPEVKGYLDGEYDLEAATALLKRNTRQYAKRQMTWFRKDKRLAWVDVSRVSAAKRAILSALEESRN